jgi:hypothetical protein
MSLLTRERAAAQQTEQAIQEKGRRVEAALQAVAQAEEDLQEQREQLAQEVRPVACIAAYRHRAWWRMWHRGAGHAVCCMLSKVAALDVLARFAFPNR